MKTLNLQQGSPEWLAVRAKHYTASEAPVMMGASSKAMRNELLALKATGIEADIEAFLQKLFDKGHAAEEAARPIAEEIIGETLFPATGIDENEYLLASFDGITMGEDVIWEHKLYNQGLAASIEAEAIADEYIWQMEQQLLVSGAEKCLFMCSDGTSENLAAYWYYPQPGRAEQLLAGWEQFEKDVLHYKPVEAKPVPTGVAPMDLPALHIEIKGEVTASNLSEYKERALAVFEDINRDLVTDQDFANAEKTVKWCKEIEAKLEITEERALAECATIDELLKTLKHLRGTSREVRLELEKAVKAQKALRKQQIALEAKQAVDDHISALARGLGVPLPHIAYDFNGAMKAKRTIESLQNAADTEAARAKIEASRIAEIIRENLKQFDDAGNEYAMLFADKAHLLVKESEFVTMTIKSRIADHKEAQEKAEAARKAEQERKEAAERAAAQTPPAEETPAPTPTQAVSTPPPVSQQPAATVAHLSEVPAKALTDYQKAIIAGIKTGYRDAAKGMTVEECIDSFLTMKGYPVAI